MGVHTTGSPLLADDRAAAAALVFTTRSGVPSNWS